MEQEHSLIADLAVVEDVALCGSNLQNLKQWVFSFMHTARNMALPSFMPNARWCCLPWIWAILVSTAA